MINFYFKTWEVNDIWTANIYANSDLLITIDEYASDKEASIAAQAFIEGIKFARGESHE